MTGHPRGPEKEARKDPRKIRATRWGDPSVVRRRPPGTLGPAWTPPPPSLLVGGACENRPEPGTILTDRLLASLSADKETMAEESRAMLLLLVGGQRLFVRAPSGARTEKRCQWRLQARDPPRSLQGRRVPTCSSKQVLHRREQGALGNPPGSRWGAKALALHIVRYGGERRGWHGNPFDGRRLTHDLPEEIGHPARSLVLYDGGGCNPREGKTGRRVAVHGGVVVGVDDAIVVRSTAGEKKRCLERIPSSGSSRQATQETGAAIAAAAWSVPRHTKHAKCPSPGAREAGQEAHRSPEKDSQVERSQVALKRGRLSAASLEPLPPAWEIRVEVFIFFLIVVLNFSLISTRAERKGRMSDGIHRII
ncbi:unnamed protein product [Boreogadus saida]